MLVTSSFSGTAFAYQGLASCLIAFAARLSIPGRRSLAGRF
jgi:hypothetical protein